MEQFGPHTAQQFLPEMNRFAGLNAEISLCHGGGWVVAPCSLESVIRFGGTYGMLLRNVGLSLSELYGVKTQKILVFSEFGDLCIYDLRFSEHNLTG
jgi:hypothetical protein